MVDFAFLWEQYAWRPIPGCAGRYLLKGGGSRLLPQQLLGNTAAVTEYNSPHAPDPVAVAVFAGGGLISYRKADGTYVHTLNDTYGLRKKLEKLGITPGDPPSV